MPISLCSASKNLVVCLLVCGFCLGGLVCWSWLTLSQWWSPATDTHDVHKNPSKSTGVLKKEAQNWHYPDKILLCHGPKQNILPKVGTNVNFDKLLLSHHLWIWPTSTQRIPFKGGNRETYITIYNHKSPGRQSNKVSAKKGASRRTLSAMLGWYLGRVGWDWLDIAVGFPE